MHGISQQLWAGQPVGKTEEACVRTIAGRAYYAAYLSTREALRTAYNDSPYDVGHEPLYEFMIGSRQPTLMVAGNSLKELFEARVLADYKPQDKNEA